MFHKHMSSLQFNFIISYSLYILNCVNASIYLQSWKSDAKFLCIVGGDDQCLDPSYMEHWYSKWPTDQRHKVQFIKYPGTGHLIEPPYSPLHRVTAILIPWSKFKKRNHHVTSENDMTVQFITFVFLFMDYFINLLTTFSLGGFWYCIQLWVPSSLISEIPYWFLSSSIHPFLQ